MRIHHPAILRHLSQTYALAPPRSSQTVHDAAARESGTEPVVAQTEPDGKFAAVLHSVGARGPLGTLTEPGWWRSVDARLHIADANVRAPAVIPIDEVLAGRMSPGILEIHAALPGGKHADEIAPYVIDGTLRITALGAPAVHGTDVHADLVKSLPFSLSETEGQRERRDQVPLPFAPHTDVGGAVRGSTGKSSIFFEPESDDDEDDEDPDDDLDL